ncbi:MAG: murein L,D-transpeptidase catalytic domain family protein [Gammaproteobacteria bacterium]|nr:murein L,D-transpeptidase catalytic domain family protein [Gammaproteobacteria bacterium]
MIKVRYLFPLFLAFLGTTSYGFSLSSLFTSTTNSAPFDTSEWVAEEIRIINSQADNIDERVLKLGLTAYINARHKGLDNKQLLTLIDYSKPSTERRLWVFDLKSNKVLFNTWVTHGRNSGNLVPTSFSNQSGSLKSSLGVFLTQSSYQGGNGYSLRLNGLERGINDNAYRRSIVIHGAWYADPGIIKRYGQIGRSWGCPAVSPDTANSLINTIKNNTLVVAYYPDQLWLKKSTFLAG